MHKLIKKFNKDSFFNFIVSRDAKNIFEVVKSAAENYSEFRKKPTYYTAFSSIASFVSTCVTKLHMEIDDYFYDWQKVYNEEFSKLILSIFDQHEKIVIGKMDESTSIIHVNINNVTFAYQQYNDVKIQQYSLPVIYCHKSQDICEAKKIIRDEIWNKINNSNIVIRAIKNGPWESQEKIAIDLDTIHVVHKSKRALQITKKLKKCFKNNITRSILFYGEPGTGKSTLCQTIVSNLKFKTLRVRVEDVSKINNQTFAETIDIFKPDAIILDDFDRLDDQSSILETLEFFQKHVKFVAITVNVLNSLDPALLRPGRIDEIIEVSAIEENVVRNILQPPVSDDVFNAIKGLPVSYIQEFQKRRKFMSEIELQNSIKELLSRADSLKCNSGSPYDMKDDSGIKVVKAKPAKIIGTGYRKRNLTIKKVGKKFKKKCINA